MAQDGDDRAEAVAQDLLDLSLIMRRRGRYFLGAVLAVVLLIAPAIMLAQNILDALEEAGRRAEWRQDQADAKADLDQRTRELDDRIAALQPLLDEYRNLARRSDHLWNFTLLDIDTGDRLRTLPMLPAEPNGGTAAAIALFETESAGSQRVLHVLERSAMNNWLAESWPVTLSRMDPGSRIVRVLRLDEDTLLPVMEDGRSGIARIGADPSARGGIFRIDRTGLPGPTFSASATGPRPRDMAFVGDQIAAFSLTATSGLRSNDGQIETGAELELRRVSRSRLESFVRNDERRAPLADLFAQLNMQGRWPLNTRTMPTLEGVVSSGFGEAYVLVAHDGVLEAMPVPEGNAAVHPGPVVVANGRSTSWRGIAPDGSLRLITSGGGTDTGSGGAGRLSTGTPAFVEFLHDAVELPLTSEGAVPGAGNPVGPLLAREDGSSAVLERVSGGVALWALERISAGTRIFGVESSREQMTATLTRIEMAVSGGRFVPETASLIDGDRIALAGRFVERDGRLSAAIAESVALPAIPATESELTAAMQHLAQLFPDDEFRGRGSFPAPDIWNEARYRQPRTTMLALMILPDAIRGAPIASNALLDFARKAETQVAEMETSAEGVIQARTGLAVAESPFEERPRLEAFDATFVNELALRIGLVLLALFAVQIMANQARYAMRMEAFYRSRYDALQIARADGGLSAEELATVVQAMSSDSMDFGKSPTPPSQQIIDIGKTVIGRGGKS